MQSETNSCCEYYENYDLDNIVTPVNVSNLERILEHECYDPEKTKFLVDGFTSGFDIGYKGQQLRQSEADNIPFMPGVGEKYEMWNKIMKEVKAKRFAGPFDCIPYDCYIQSPISLVPKSGSRTRLIFHLSYQFSNQPEGISLNAGTPKNKCSVNYNDIDVVVASCLKISEHGKLHPVFFGKTDVSNAFCVLPL